MSLKDNDGQNKSDYRKFTFDVTIKISADFWTRKLWYVLIHKHRQNIVLVDLDVAMFTKLKIFWDRLCKNNCKATSLIELFVQDNRYQDWFLSYINKRLSEFVVYNGHLLRMATLCWLEISLGLHCNLANCLLIFRQRIVQDRSFQIEQAYRKSLCIWVVLKVFKNLKRNVLKNNSFSRVKKSPSG